MLLSAYESMHLQEKLQLTLDALDRERSQIAAEGWYLQHCWLVQVKPGGNARTACKYWQVRSRKALFDGKKLKHLKPDLVEAYKVAIERGRRLDRIERQIEKLKLQQLAVTTDSLNLIAVTLPPSNLILDPGKQQPKEAPKIELFTNLTEQERLVKEALAKSQTLRASLRQSIMRCKAIGARNTLLIEDTTAIGESSDRFNHP